MATIPPPSTPAAAPRRYKAPCPGCGAPVEFQSAQSTHAVCSYCQSTVVRSAGVLSRIGKMAELFDDHSPLQLHASGRIDGQAFTLIGRLQYQSDAGTWTEWVASLDDGSVGSLGEDNGAYVFSRPIDAGRELPAAERFRVGAQTSINGQPYQVAFSGPVQLLAAQGELAQLPQLGQPFAMVELRSTSGAEVLSIDYSRQPPQLERGRAVQLEDLQMQGLKTQSTKQEQARHFNCPRCGAQVQVRLSTSKSITCGSCNSLIDLGHGIGQELLLAEQSHTVRPLIALGSQGTLQGTAWQVVGFQHRSGREAGDDENFGWEEYLLYNRQRGFIFLVDASDGWSLVRPTTGATKVTGNGSKAEYAGATYSRTWSYNAETSYVLGEFYWPVRRGQKTFNRDYAVGERLLSLEQTGSEQTWSAGAKLDFNQVARAFKLQDKAALFRRQDAAPVSLGDAGSTLIKIIVVMMLVLAGMWLLAAMFGASSSGSGSGWGRSSGGSFGGYSSGGGHK